MNGELFFEQALTRRHFLTLSGGAAASIILAACDTEDTATSIVQSHQSVTTLKSPEITISTETTLPLAETTQSIETTSLPGSTTTEVVITPELSPVELFLHQAATTLLHMHEESLGGWRFKSAIQAPHYQTDRDVGASSVGMGFMAMAEKYPHDPQWLNGAEQSAVWLLAVSKTDASGGRYWNDFVDDSETSDAAYTSFDDGTIGIADFLWRLSEKTGKADYANAALEAVNWTLSQAEVSNGGYRWKWDASDHESPYYMGMGEGLVGIVHTLATFYERTAASRPDFAATCKQYIDGALAYLDATRAALADELDGDSRPMPETGVIGDDGDTTMNAGYLSGSAGGAFMYLKLFQTFGDPVYLAKADELFSWLEDTDTGPIVQVSDESVTWKLELDPEGDDDPQFATGMEEGNAGIGWTYLEAYNLTGQDTYLHIARQAANWLLNIAVIDTNGGYTWHEDENPQNPITHANLNNGAAGIGMFLNDLALATGGAAYAQGAQGALKGLMNSAIISGESITWNDNDGENDYSNDPSWHWGSAGIIAFIARMTGNSLDIPGEQPALYKHP